jgi:hypothetical protein
MKKWKVQKNILNCMRLILNQNNFPIPMYIKMRNTPWPAMGIINFKDFLISTAKHVQIL